MNIYIYYTVYIDFLLEQRKKGDRSFSTYSVRWCHDDASKSIVVFFAFQFNVNNVWYFLPFHFGSSKQAPAPLSTRSPFPSRQPQCHCPSRWKRPSCWLSWWLSWWLWWRLCCLWWRLCWARRLPMPRKSLPVRWGQNQSPPTLVLEAKASNTSVGAFLWGLGACHLGHGKHVEKPPATSCMCNCLCTRPTFMRLQNVRAKEVPFHRCSFNAQYRQRMRQTYWWGKMLASKKNDPTYTMVKVHGTVPKR